jgi:hypothetical protein
MGIHLATELAKARTAALVLALLCPSVALAKDLPAKELQWRDAKVIDVTTETGRAAVVPIAALVGRPTTKTFYWIQTNDTIYVLGPVLTRSQLLKVTLHGPTKLAIVGNNAHLLDDYGKNQRLRVIEKIARPESANPQQAPR